MPPRVLIKTRPLCECGDKMEWRAYGIKKNRWRLECICGRCGPWRSEPERTSIP